MPGSSEPEPEAYVTTDELIAEARVARESFLAALAPIAPDSLTTPGLVGDWSAREIIAHLGYWAGHGTEAIHAVETGRAEQFGMDEPSVDEVNATVARVARQTDLGTVRRREAASFEALVERVAGIDPAILPTPLPHYGLTLEGGIREDGAIHYRGHADELRRVLTERPHG